jgi:hypothetical protein
MGTSPATDSNSPSANSGYYYVVRGNGWSGATGTYDEGGSQVGWRDAEIEASGVCP